jgi:uncharacterized glyoxalase superfamily protein PhnB
MKSTPKGWPRISSAVFYAEPRKAIDWLCKAFGFEVKLLIEGDDGVVHHSELVYGEGMIMVGGVAETSAHPEATHRKSPAHVGGANTQAMMVFVDDVDAHCARARELGATIVAEPKSSDYGEDYWEDRSYEAVDLEGHHWWFCQRIRDPKS